jgi:hypothetical protein
MSFNALGDHVTSCVELGMILKSVAFRKSQMIDIAVLRMAVGGLVETQCA